MKILASALNKARELIHSGKVPSDTSILLAYSQGLEADVQNLNTRLAAVEALVLGQARTLPTPAPLPSATPPPAPAPVAPPAPVTPPPVVVVTPPPPVTPLPPVTVAPPSGSAATAPVTAPVDTGV